jgi:CHAT domain-containing protein
MAKSKILYIFLFFLNCQFLYCQNLSKATDEFWNGIRESNNSKIIENGTIIINALSQNFPILLKQDSTIIELYTFTAKSYMDIDSLNESQYYYQKAIELLEKNINTETKYLEDCYFFLGNNYILLDKPQEGIDALLKSSEINVKITKKNTPRLGEIFSIISYQYLIYQEYNASIYYSQNALKVFKECGSINSSLIAGNLDNIAKSNLKLNDLISSMDYFLAEENIYRKYIGTNNEDYTILLANIASLYYDLGNFEKALQYNFIALEEIKNVFGNRHISYSHCLSRIGSCYSALGQESEALHYSLLNLKLHEELGELGFEYAVSLDNIGNRYRNIGDFQKAIEYSFKALDIFKETVGKKSKNYARCLMNLALNYSGTDRMDLALVYNKEALRIHKELNGENSKEYAVCLSNLASNYYRNEKCNESLICAKKSLELKLNLFSNSHSEVIASYQNIALYYRCLNEIDSSLEYSNKAIEIILKEYSSKYPTYIACMESIATCQFLKGQFEESSKNFFKCIDQEKETFQRNISGLNYNLQNKTKSNLEFTTLLIFSLFSENKDILIKNYDNWIAINGFLDNESTHLQNEIKESKDTAIINISQELHYLKKNLIENQQLSAQNLKNQGFDLLKLEQQIQNLEFELIKKLDQFRALKRSFVRSDIFESLDSNEVFVDIIFFRKLNTREIPSTDSLNYLVFITSPKDSIVDFVFTKNATEIKNNTVSEIIMQSSMKEEFTDLKNPHFYNTLWKPIAEKIGSAKTIYLSLGGFYNNFNVNTLYNPETSKYLLEENDIRIVNSARDFVLNKESEKKKYTSNTASLFGFPNFDGNTTVTADSSDLFASIRDLNTFWLDSLTRGGLKAKPLPETKTEVENISSTLKSNGWQVNSFIADNASETNIKKQQSPRILHVATHGYFFQDIPMDQTDDRFMGMDRERVVHDPMLRSGLLFKGANKTLQGEESKGENGLLSAAEASLLDLRDTELVVLSACETGKGEVKNSEGVYGLRKAFSDAGAKNIIMSLWKVDDKVTQEFMTRFYEIWLNEKTTIREAFTKTQLEIKAKYPQPYYWGAFILVGE